VRATAPVSWPMAAVLAELGQYPVKTRLALTGTLIPGEASLLLNRPIRTPPARRTRLRLGQFGASHQSSPQDWEI